MEENNYNGWLVSKSLVKRSLAVWGHLMLAQIVVFIVFMLMMIVLGIVVGFMSVFV